MWHNIVPFIFKSPSLCMWVGCPWSLSRELDFLKPGYRWLLYCGPQCECRQPNLGPLEEEQSFLTTDPSFQGQCSLFKFFKLIYIKCEFLKAWTYTIFTQFESFSLGWICLWSIACHQCSYWSVFFYFFFFEVNISIILPRIHPGFP